MSAISPDDARRLKGSLARLASPNDGEIIAAAAAIGRLLEKHGLAFCDLGVGEPIPAIAARAVDPWSRASGGPPRAEMLRDHQREAMLLMGCGFPWDQWKQTFLGNIRHRRDPLSQAQKDKLRESRALASEWREQRRAA